MCNEETSFLNNDSESRDLVNKSVQGLELGRDKSVVKTTMSARTSSSASTELQSLHKEKRTSGSDQEKLCIQQVTGMDRVRRKSDCVSDPEEQKLHDCSASGDVEKVNELLLQGVNVNSRNASARTPLHIAAYNGHISIVQALIAAGADIHSMDKLEKTSLHLAAWKGYVDIASLLVDAGADINACDCWGKSPLHHAAEAGDAPGGPGMAVCELLLSAGADKDVQGKMGRTALMMAIQKSHSEVALRLISDGAAVALKDYKGQTALHHAAVANSPAELIAALVASGVDVHSQDCTGRSPLFGATRSTTLALIGHGADPHLRDMTGQTPLHEACERASLEVVGALLESGAKVNARDKRSNTPLDLVNRISDSKRKGAKRAVEELLKHQGAKKGVASVFAACFRPIF
eukprot:2986363-Rhodomonas_salina.2